MTFIMILDFMSTHYGTMLGASIIGAFIFWEINTKILTRKIKKKTKSATASQEVKN